MTHTLTSEGADASEDGTGRGTPIVVQPLAVRGRAEGAELEIGPENGPYNCLRAGDGGSSRNQLIAIHENQRGEITTSDTMGALKTGGGKPGPAYPAVGIDTIVRRLTELECERLQGYPDGWTDGQSGAARYRQLGNSVAVPVVEWIARRLIAVDAEVTA